jgi:dihydroorotate dehydrogenase
MKFYQSVIRPILFLTDPEIIHHRVFKWLNFFLAIAPIAFITKKFFVLRHPSLRRNVFGIDFPNPVGLAAGFDKDALLFDELGMLGFGFVEIGTITPEPQPGNPKPRMFRLPKDKALINRMGFNNRGATAAEQRLKKRKSTVVIGGNIGKNKTTENDKATDDYVKCFNKLFNVVDYFVVNVSSPNTPGLRSLQEKIPLLALLLRLQKENDILSNGRKRKPLLLKIAPDLSDEQLDDIISVVEDAQLHGVIATNTTIDRSNLLTDKNTIQQIGAGGLSGKPLTNRSTEVIRYLVQNRKNSFAIIGVGGIHSVQDALDKLDAGADLIQLYTGFIYEGPGLVRDINRELINRKS